MTLKKNNLYKRYEDFLLNELKVSGAVIKKTVPQIQKFGYKFMGAAYKDIKLSYSYSYTFKLDVFEKGSSFMQDAFFFKEIPIFLRNHLFDLCFSFLAREELLSYSFFPKDFYLYTHILDNKDGPKEAKVLIAFPRSIDPWIAIDLEVILQEIFILGFYLFGLSSYSVVESFKKGVINYKNEEESYHFLERIVSKLLIEAKKNCDNISINKLSRVFFMGGFTFSNNLGEKEWLIYTKGAQSYFYKFSSDSILFKNMNIVYLPGTVFLTNLLYQLVSQRDIFLFISYSGYGSFRKDFYTNYNLSLVGKSDLV